MGEPRQSRLTRDEQQSEFTLWAITRSPLILGANLTKLDDFTRSLMTNKEVLEINQKAWESKPVKDLPAGFENVRVWEASEEAFVDPPEFVALFNLDDKPVTLHFMWKQICQMCASDGARNLYDGRQLKASDPVKVTLSAHGSTIFRSLNKVTGQVR
jgi:hypothetical protein